MKNIATIMLALCLGLSMTSAFAGGDAPYKRIGKAADSSDDPLIKAVITTVRAYENNFSDVLGDPIDEPERERQIQNNLDFDVFSQAKSRMERMREAEMYADSARFLNVDLEEAAYSYYWSQQTVMSMASSNNYFVTWEFDVPFEERDAAAKKLFSRLEAVFSQDRKWRKSVMDNAKLNPYLVQMIYNYTLGGNGMDQLWVTVEYARNEKYYVPYGMVVVRVYRTTTKLG